MSFNALTIITDWLPPQTMGYLLCAQAEGNAQFLGSSSGILSLGGRVGRYVNQVQSSGFKQRIDAVVDLGGMPHANGGRRGAAG